MIGSILLLVIVVFGLQILFGRGKPENLVKFVVFLIFGPILLAIGFNHLLWFWGGLPLWAEVLCLLLIPFLLAAFLKMAFPRAAWLNFIQAFVFDTVLFIFTFPFRFIYRAFRLFFQRERRRVPLDPYRPAVGRRPPILYRRNDNRPFDP